MSGPLSRLCALAAMVPPSLEFRVCVPGDDYPRLRADDLRRSMDSVGELTAACDALIEQYDSGVRLHGGDLESSGVALEDHLDAIRTALAVLRRESP